MAESLESKISDLVVLQKDLLDTLEKVSRNFRKDGEERKNLKYFENRIERVKSYAKDFGENHKNLLLLDLKRESTYFHEDFADSFEQLYVHTLTFLDSERDNRFPPDLGADASANELPSAVTNGTPEVVVASQANLNSSANDFPPRNQSQIAGFGQSTMNPFLNNGTQATDFGFASLNPFVSNLQSSLHLDKISVPKFDSTFQGWPHFHDMFVSLVHNNPRLSRVERFFYLKGSLTINSEASNLIRHLPITELNYDSAWNLLVNFYDNPRQLFQTHMNLLVSQPKIFKEDASSMRSLLSVARECRAALLNFQLDLNHCDPILIFLISQRLPPETVGFWETKAGDSKNLSKFSEFELFLEIRIRTLQAISDSKQLNGSAKPASQSQPNRGFVRNSFQASGKFESRNALSCAICKQEHEFRKCPKFLSMSCHDRLKAARRARVCFNCLSPSHLNADCKSTLSCHCGARHHTSLHLDSNSRQNSSNVSNAQYSSSHAQFVPSDATQTSMNVQNSYLPQFSSSQAQFVPSQNPFNTLGATHAQYSNANSQFGPSVTPHSSSYASSGVSTAPYQSNFPVSTNSNASNSCVQSDVATTSAVLPATASAVLPSNNSYRSHMACNISSCVLLPTALVKVLNGQGKWITLRALLDTGSEPTIISERAAKKLMLPQHKIAVTITGVGDAPADTLDRFVRLRMCSNVNDYQLDAISFIIRKFDSVLPIKSIYGIERMPFGDLVLADPTFSTPDKIDLILGSEVFAQVVLEGLRKSPEGITAQNTQFGWIVFGSIAPPNGSDVTLRTMTSRVEIDRLLRKFWEVEEVPSERERSRDEKYCERHFVETHERLPSGRYRVRLPFRSGLNPDSGLGRSRQIAIASFMQLERRFSRDAGFHAAYVAAVEDYIRAGHLVPVETSEDDRVVVHGDSTRIDCCYLPHHAIIKETSTTTKVRIVFDASRKTANGRSLNDTLLPGPALHNDLPSVITNWRFHNTVFAGDLEKMFLNVEMHPDDAQYQRVVWRRNPNEPLRDYYMPVVMFGTSSAPFLAMRTVQQLALDMRHEYPQIYDPIMRGLFVDDLYGGADDVPAALEMQRQLIAAFRAGGFHLRKWVSNREELLGNVPKEDIELKLPFSLNEKDSVKTLGLFWSPSSDTFSYRFSFDLDEVLQHPTTMRHVLSTISRLFDPLGFIGPVTLNAKCFLRKLREEGLDWDDVASPQFVAKWTEFVQDLKYLPQLQIPRWLSTTTGTEIFEFHGFSDASEIAYSATIYLRCVSGANVSCNLLVAKTKIAPCKPGRTIPELELMGAKMLADLMKHTLGNWNATPIPKVYAWTDSEIVIHWLRGDANRWPIFVANRVNRILEIIPEGDWRHVPSEQNPADHGTRGLKTRELIDTKIWFKGPDFLHSHPMNFPPQGIFEMDDLEQMRAFNIRVPNAKTMEVMNSFSNYDRLLRTTARLQILAKSVRKEPNAQNHEFLTVSELNEARDFWIQTVQRHDFSLEYAALENKRPLPLKSRIRNLNPFLDEKGLMRVGGRLANAPISYDAKHPIILPPKSNFTKLLILFYHDITMHGGAQLVLTFLRKKYWILQARNAVRFLLLKCTRCFRFRASGGQQLMADLPRPRVNPSFLFEHTGVDFAGPITVRASKGRGRITYKGYIAIFICFSTRAIHIELAGDLSLPTFLGCLRRFLARRTMCSNFYSDNGTTFVGAANLFKSQASEWRKRIESEVLPELTRREISWHFNPASAPHFGGIWERSVRSVKYHLKRVCKSRSYTYEEWTTLLVSIEGILNSRPLCPMSSDPEDLTAVTPNHFLNGDLTTSIPEPLNPSLNSLPHRLRELTELRNSFWNRWSNEYLSQLQSRPKWLNVTENLCIDDLVLIKEDNLPPSSWKMGRVIELRPGRDGLVRSVKLKTSGGTFERPIVKLCRLPIEKMKSELETSN